MDVTEDDTDAMNRLTDEELFVWRYYHIRAVWVRRVFYSLAWMLSIELALIITGVIFINSNSDNYGLIEDLPTAVWQTLTFICLGVLSAYHHPVDFTVNWPLSHVALLILVQLLVCKQYKVLYGIYTFYRPYGPLLYGSVIVSSLLFFLAQPLFNLSMTTHLQKIIGGRQLVLYMDLNYRAKVAFYLSLHILALFIYIFNLNAVAKGNIVL